MLGAILSKKNATIRLKVAKIKIKFEKRKKKILISYLMLPPGGHAALLWSGKRTSNPNAPFSPSQTHRLEVTSNKYGCEASPL